MATDFGYGGDAMQGAGQPGKGSGCLKGCLIAAVIAALLVAVGILVLWLNWRNWASTLIATGIKANIDASDLPPAEKDDIKAQIDRVADAFREDRLTGEQAAVLIQKVFESPLLTSLVASAAGQRYIDPSGLTDAEKAEARQTLRRFVRGAFDGSISTESVNAAMQHIADRQPNDQWRLRNQVSDEELQAFLVAAKRDADDAGVPDQPDTFDPSDEVKQIVDEVLGEN